MANILTYNNLITTFKDIQKRHRQINSFFTGKGFDLGASDQLEYPVLTLEPISSRLLNSENGLNVFELVVHLQIGDLVNKDLSNETDVLSDSLQILQDIVKEFEQHPFYVKSNLNIRGDVDFEPFKGVSDEDLTGWETDLRITLISNQAYCKLPFSGISSNSFPNV